MPFGATFYKQATVAGAAGSGANYAVMVECHRNGIPIESLGTGVEGSVVVSGTGQQGVATDGTFYYTTTSDVLSKWVVTNGGATWTRDSFRDVTGDDPLAKTQVNGIAIRDGILYLGASDFNQSVSTLGWIVEYNASDLTPTGNFYPVGAFTCEGGAWRQRYDNGEWEFFVCYHDSPYIERYNDAFVLQEGHTVDSLLVTVSGRSEGFFQGASFMGDVYVTSGHGGAYTGAPRIEGFRWREDDNTFSRTFSFVDNTASQPQQTFIDVPNNELLRIDRVNNRVWTHPINYLPGCVDLEGQCRSDFGDVVVTDVTDTAISGNGVGWREYVRTADMARLWFKHPNDLGTDQDIRVFYGDASRTWTDEGTSFCDQYEGFESGTVGLFTNNYQGAIPSIETAPSPVLDGTYSLSKEDAFTGVHPDDDTFLPAGKKRLIFYCWAEDDNRTPAMRLFFEKRIGVSGSIKRDFFIIDNTGLPSGFSGYSSSFNLTGRWLRVECGWDYDGDQQRVLIDDEHDWRQCAFDLVRSLSSTSAPYDDFMPYGFGWWDHVFSLPWVGTTEPEIGLFGPAQPVTPEPPSEGNPLVMLI